MKEYHHLTWYQRVKIEALRNSHVPVYEIADNVGVSPQTIYNELKRGLYQKKVTRQDPYSFETIVTYVDSYSSDIAQAKYEQHLRDKGTDIKLGTDFEFEHYVERMICDEGYSPEAVLGKIKHDPDLKFDTHICVGTLYSWIYGGVFERLTVKNLMYGGKRHKLKTYQIKKKRCRDCAGDSIEKRPEWINDRSEFGNWEMDCICGSSKACMLTLCERLSRFTLLFKLPDQKAVSVVSVLNKLERKLGKDFHKIFRSITVDNGSEFSDCTGISASVYSVKIKRCAVFYTHPYSAYERGTNERLNRDVRRWIPKGTDLSTVTDEKLSSVQEWVNNYPRKIFDFASASEIYSACKASI